jgi:hypothetical protein
MPRAGTPVLPSTRKLAAVQTAVALSFVREVVVVMLPFYPTAGQIALIEPAPGGPGAPDSAPPGTGPSDTAAPATTAPATAAPAPGPRAPATPAKAAPAPGDAAPGGVVGAAKRPLTGIVEGAGIDTMTITGLSAQGLASDVEVVVSIFAPEALYRIQGSAHWIDPGRLVVDPIRDVERIQRRRWPRHALHVDVTLASLDGYDGVGGVTGRTIDIGMGGLRVETVFPLTPGVDLTAMFTLPDRSCVVARTIVVSAKVSDSGCEYGLAFERLEDADATHLMALVGAQAVT